MILSLGRDMDINVNLYLLFQWEHDSLNEEEFDSDFSTHPRNLNYFLIHKFKTKVKLFLIVPPTKSNIYKYNTTLLNYNYLSILILIKISLLIFLFNDV